ncbi:MAG: hypothetical protein RLZ56_62 [Bacteroidota bacterium]|jgi:hypothetical protein
MRFISYISNINGKAIFVFLMLLPCLLPISLQAQSNLPGINFQAVAKDALNNPANSRRIYVKASIENGYPSGAVVYGDEHEVFTNEYGVFSICIGKGHRFTGALSLYQIDWNQLNYFIHLFIAIEPLNVTPNWDHNAEWVDMGAVPFGVVPYAIHAISSSGGGVDTTSLNTKLNIADTSAMLLPYKRGMMSLDSFVNNSTGLVHFNDSSRVFVTPYQLSLAKTDTNNLHAGILSKLSIIDTANMLLNYVRQIQFLNALGTKLNIGDTASMLAHYVNSSQLNTALALKLSIADTLGLWSGLNARELLLNKSTNIGNVNDYNDDHYPSVKAIKDYVDLALIAGAPDATTNNKGIIMLAGDLTGVSNAPTIVNNAIGTSKIQDASVTDAKIASGINPAKVGLGNLTNNAQLYNLNGLTAQMQSFAQPGNSGLAPNWVSSGSTHTLHIPMASASAVSGGLISKLDYDHFTTAYSNSINGITNNGNNGLAAVINNVLNIPAYSLVGLAGNTAPNTIFAGPVNGSTAAAAGFRALVAADIPNNNANTTGNAGSASKLLNARFINNVLFDGTADISGVNANTPNSLNFKDDGLGAAAGVQFNGSVAKDISYNTIGAAPSIGSTSITTLGSINTGTWAANIIGANYGGAGSNNGILKANGSGIVSTAVAGTDYIAPFGVQNAKYIYAAPNAASGNPSFRLLLASDIPILNQNTTGNAATSTALQNAVLINNVAFNGTNDITITANTPNAITFTNTSSAALPGTQYNGATSKTISYNTIGAAPANGSTNINTLGNITTGNWMATVIGANYGGAGNNNGILKADGSGVVSVASAGTDFQLPIQFSSPLVNTSNTISIAQASNSNNGYLSSSDWSSFNNKIDITQKAANNGVASLDANGKIPTSQIPSISFSSGYVVTSQTDMLALSNAVVGSIAIRTDNSKNYVLSGLPASVLSNWLELLMPVSVSSVNGHTESNITLTTTDIAEGTRLFFTNTRARDAINATSPIVYTASTGNIALPAASATGGGYLTAADWNNFNNKIGAFTSQAASTFYAGPSSGSNATPSFRTILATDIPILNQATTANAGTATKLATSRNINGIPFDGSNDITISASLSNPIIFDNSGQASTSVSFNGTLTKTVSYNTIGAAPAAGSSSITSLGSITSGTWLANVIDAAHGGAGVTNGILKADGSGNVSAAVAGTDYVAPFSAQTSKYFYAAPNASNGAPIFRAILSSDIPTLNQNTTGNAASATKLINARNINGVLFDGTADITIASNLNNAISFDNSGTGVNSGSTFNGATAKTISYNSIGAAPSNGSSNINTVGTITTGTWSASVIDANHGGAGTVNGILKANGSGLVTAAVAGSDFENVLSFGAPLSRSNNTVSIAAATTSTNGYLTASDWNLFNAKQTSIVAGTGVNITGGNTIAIGQAVATTSSPSFAGASLTGLNTAGIVTNSAAGVLGTIGTTGTGNVVKATSPSLVTPVLGDATATSIVAGTITSTGDISAKRYKLTMPSNITATATTNIDLGAGNVFTVVLNTSITSLTITNQAVGTYLIKFVQDNTGSRTVSFPVGWKWAGGAAPSLTSTATKLDIVTLIYDGTSYYATIVKNF